MFRWVKYSCNNKNIDMGNKETPILFIYGDKDVISNYGKTAHQAVEIYKNLGYKNIYEIVYENMRHEILNETNNEKVYNDIINFIKK